MNWQCFWLTRLYWNCIWIFWRLHRFFSLILKLYTIGKIAHDLLKTPSIFQSDLRVLNFDTIFDGGIFGYGLNHLKTWIWFVWSWRDDFVRLLTTIFLPASGIWHDWDFAFGIRHQPPRCFFRFAFTFVLILRKIWFWHSRNLCLIFWRQNKFKTRWTKTRLGFFRIIFKAKRLKKKSFCISLKLCTYELY